MEFCRKEFPSPVWDAFLNLELPTVPLQNYFINFTTNPPSQKMPRPKRNLLATVEDTLTPPEALSEDQVIARITKAAGNSLYNAELPGGKAVLVELEAKFRSTIWIKRGSYVVVDTRALADRDNKLDGEIVNIVREEKQWRKMSYWCVDGYQGKCTLVLIHSRPKEFAKKSVYPEDSDEDESTVGKLPPTDSDEE